MRARVYRRYSPQSTREQGCRRTTAHKALFAIHEGAGERDDNGPDSEGHRIRWEYVGKLKKSYRHLGKMGGRAIAGANKNYFFLVIKFIQQQQQQQQQQHSHLQYAPHFGGQFLISVFAGHAVGHIGVAVLVLMKKSIFPGIVTSLGFILPYGVLC